MTRGSWPAEVTIGYLARRAGMSRDQMRRRLRRIPALAHVFEPNRWTRITLADIKAMDPRLYESIQLRSEHGAPDTEEEEAA